MAVDYFDAKKYPCYSWVLFVRGTQISFFLGRSIYMSRYALESPVPPADLNALSPGYRVPPDLATVP